MWDCKSCGCKAIAASLTWCPMCREESYGLEKYGPPHLSERESPSFEEVVVKTLNKVKGDD